MPEKTNSSSAKQWPGAFGVYKQSKEAVSTNVGTLIGLIVVNILASVVINALFRDERINQLLNNVVSIVIGPMYLVTILRGVAGKKIQLSDAASEGYPYILQYLILAILIWLALVGSLLALVIPFFFVMPRLILAPYFLIDKKLEALDAFKASWNQTKGHSAKVWGIIGATFVMILPVLTIIGIPFTIYLVFMYSAASAILYKHIAK